MGTGFGVHHPSDFYWNPPSVLEFCEDLKRHGVSWYLLWANDLHQLELARGLVEHGIEVVYRPGPMRIPTRIPGGILPRYREVGVRYCQFYNEANLGLEWVEGMPKGAPEKFADLLEVRIRDLEAMDFVPVISPLSPGGELHHRKFFKRMMARWSGQGLLPELVEGCVLGIHNRPMENPPDSTEACSFNEYKWWREVGGMPMIATEAGYEPQWCKRADGTYDWELWKLWNLELIRRFRRGHPKYVGDDFLGQIFWIYHDSGRVHDHCGLVENWYYARVHGGDRTTNLWRALAAEDWEEGGNGPDPRPRKGQWLRYLDGVGVVYKDLRSQVWDMCRQDAVMETLRKFDEVTGVVVHHIVGSVECVQAALAVARDHIVKRKRSQCGYHAIIGQDGTVYIMGRIRWTAPGSGRWYVNRHAMQVAFSGNMEKEWPTAAQMEAFRKLLDSFSTRSGVDWTRHKALWLLPHRFVVATDCPGDNLVAAVLGRKGSSWA